MVCKAGVRHVSAKSMPLGTKHTWKKTENVGQSTVLHIERKDGNPTQYIMPHTKRKSKNMAPNIMPRTE